MPMYESNEGNQSVVIKKFKLRNFKYYLTIGSCFSVHYRVMEHAGSLESTKEA